MTVTVSQTASNAMADTLNTQIGTSHTLRLYTAGDALLVTLTYAASQGVVSTDTGAEVITYSEASYTDDETPVTGAASYAAIHTSGGTEVVRFTNPTTELGLSSTSIDSAEPVRVTADVVVKFPNST